MTSDTAELHPIEGAIYQAANVASADPLEAADIVKLLRVLLHPDSEVRAQASTSTFKSTVLPLLFAANSCVLPECPIEL